MNLLYEDAQMVLGPLNYDYLLEYRDAAKRLAKYFLDTRCNRDCGPGNHCGRDKNHDGPCAVFMKINENI